MSADPPATSLLRSRFFWNLFASYTVVLVVTGGLVGWRVENRMEHRLHEDLRENLESSCSILVPFAREVLQGGERPGLQHELEELTREAGLRITLMRSDGKVVGDSHEDPALMDDHSNRPEIVQARSEGLGVARRLSHTVGQEMLYVANRIDVGGSTIGYARVSLPVTQIQLELDAIRRSVVLGTGAGVLLALFFGLLLSRRITRPILSMTHSAQAMSAGRYDQRVPVTRADELGILARALNDIGAEVTRRIAALSQEDAQLRAMLAGMIEGVVAVDDEDKVAFLNHAARQLLDLPAGEQVGRTLWDLVPIRELQALIARARASAGHELIEVDLFRGTKGERIFQAHASPFRGGGRGGVVLVLHDITELRRLERIRRDFVANVSHELKTPLTTIRGFVETLLAGALHDEHNSERFLKRIDANVKRLTNLVTDLLSLARIESGQLTVERTAVDWREVLDGVLSLREAALVAKGQQLHVSGREVALRVRGDREAMTQVLDNLLDNAIQYTPSGGRIQVRLAASNGHGVVAVQDTGMGIPAADVDRIFERFYRVDKARSRVAGGTGLGLSIVKNLVMRMDGEVSVQSVEGQGATFTVVLPLA